MINGLKKILYVLDPYAKKKLVTVFFMILMGAAAELIGVSVVYPLINLAIDPGEVMNNRYCRVIVALTGADDARTVMLLLILFTAFVYALKNCYLAWMNNAIYRFSLNVRRRISVRLMQAYLKQPYSFFLDRNSAEILRSINSDTANFNQVVLNILQIASNGILCMVIAGYLIISNWQITVIVSCAILGCYAVVYLVVNRKLKRLGKENQHIGGEVIRQVQETFQGIKEVKVLRREEFFSAEYEKNYSKSANLLRKMNLLDILPKYIIETVAILAILAYLAIAVIMMGGYSTLLGQLSLFAVAAFKLLPAANGMYAYFATVMYHKASVDLVYNDIKEADELTSRVKYNASECHTDKKLFFYNSIEMRNVTFRYNLLAEPVLNNLNLCIKKGESVGIIGKSGGGKTTSVDIILGLLAPQAGGVYVDNRNISEDYDSWIKNVGYIAQNVYLSDSTIRENIAFGLKREEIDDQKVMLAIQKAQLKEYLAGLPEGVNTRIGEAGVRLSGGQRQRIGIARALYNDPDILVLDEATSALDNETEKAVMDAIDALHGQKTMIIIAHRLSTIEKCDRVYEIVDGKAVTR